MSKVVAVVGSYRRGGNTDRLVEAVLAGAREQGAETQTIYLTERPIEFCTNCRRCTLAPGPERGRCVQNDGFNALVAEIDAADAVIMASPVNFGSATAIFRRFLERLIGMAYWPWGQMGPKVRKGQDRRRAVLLATSTAPGFLVPMAMGSVVFSLKSAAAAFDARVVGSLWVGLRTREPNPPFSARTLARARGLGMRLATGN